MRLPNSANLFKKGLIANLFRKCLIANLLKKGLIENDVTTWSSGATQAF
ncbi:hypothetical protein [Methanosarcina sp.]